VTRRQRNHWLDLALHGAGLGATLLGLGVLAALLFDIFINLIRIFSCFCTGAGGIFKHESSVKNNFIHNLKRFLIF